MVGFSKSTLSLNVHMLRVNTIPQQETVAEVAKQDKQEHEPEANLYKTWTWIC